MKVEICLLRLLVLWGGKYLAKSALVISSHVSIDLGLKEYNQIYALSLSEKGKNFNLTMLVTSARLLNVATTSSNSRICMYELSFSNPWKVGKRLIMPGLKSKFGILLGYIMHEGVAVRVGCKYSCSVLGWTSS